MQPDDQHQPPREQAKNRQERRLLGLMLLPIAAIAAVGVWKSAQPSPPSGPTRIMLREVRSQPLSARDVGTGYDKRYEAVWACEGARPAPWGGEPAGGSWQYEILDAAPNSKPAGNVAISARDTRYDRATDTYRATLAVRWRDVPAAVGPLRLRATTTFPIVGTRISGGNAQRLKLPPAIVTVRRRNEGSAAPPRVSRQCPLRLVSIRALPGPHPRLPKVEAVIDCYEPEPSDNTKFVLSSVGPVIIAENGRRQDANNTHGVERIVRPENSVTRWKVTWDSPGQTPNVPGKLIFESFVVLNEFWPLTVRCEVPNRRK